MDMQQLLVAGLAFLAVGGLGVAFLEPILSGANRAEKRQAALSDSRARRKAIEETGTRRKQIAESLKELEQRQKAVKLTLEQRFEQAGVAWTRKTFIFISIGCALVLAMALLLITRQPILALGGLVVGGFGLPRWNLTRMAKKRQKKFIEEFPNAIEAIVRGIKSGLPLNDCFRLIATEARDPLKSEFRSVVESQTMGIAIGDACEKIYERVPLSEVNFFAIVIQIQAKSGGNLGEILMNLSKVIRDRRKLRDKVDAMSMEAKSSAMIIGALPFLVGSLVYMGSPDYISLLWTTKAGQIGLGACVAIMGVGILTMRNMINFDI
ncbi:MAG: tight adherence protein [Beijerinckiaceae bacterium]|nr:MAG: tight adherence protein [Beijerinckiaceae bacterium]